MRFVTYVKLIPASQERAAKVIYSTVAVKFNVRRHLLVCNETVQYS